MVSLHPQGTKPSSAWCKTSWFWFTSSSKRDFRQEGWLLHPYTALVSKVSAPWSYQQTQLQQTAISQPPHRLLHINKLYSLAWGCANHLLGFYPPLETNCLTKERLRVVQCSLESYSYSSYITSNSQCENYCFPAELGHAAFPQIGCFSRHHLGCLHILHLPALTLAHVDLHACRRACCFTSDDFPES